MAANSGAPERNGVTAILSSLTLQQADRLSQIKFPRLKYRVYNNMLPEQDYHTIQKGGDKRVINNRG
jgi:hypothetical protein